MRSLADQNFPRTCKELLEEFGHSFGELSYDPNTGLSDDWLFAEAQKQNAVFLTTDKDFFHTVPLLHPSHAGVIVITLAHPNRDQILEKLRWALGFIQSNPIADHVILLRDHRVLYSKRTGEL